MSTQTIESPFLRLALKADALVTGANAVAYLAAFAVLDSWLGVPAGFLVAVGAFLAVYAGLVWRVATRPRMPRAAVVAVVEANLLWAAGSVFALALDWFSPTVGGQVVIAVQAAGVVAFAALQSLALTRAARPAPRVPEAPARA
jgi:hypothetical protein